MRLLLIRHGETADNVARTIGSHLPGPALSPTGIEQARALADRLAADEVAVVHSSRALRASQTAAEVAAARGLAHHEIDGFHEIDAGDLEGLPYAEALSGYAGTMQRWWHDPDARIPGGESGTEFMARFSAAIDAVANESNEVAVVVSHEAAICVWASSTATNLDAEFSRTHGVQNTGIVELHGSPAEGWRAVSWDGAPVA